MQNVLLDYGLEGYGLYWYCLELIAGNVSVENITFSLEHDSRIIARNVGSSPQKVSEMMRYFVQVGLFEDSEGVITCLKLAKRLDRSMTSNPEMREIIAQLKSGAKNTADPPKNHDSVMTASAKPMQEEIRLDENRVDKITLDKSGVSTSTNTISKDSHKPPPIDFSCTGLTPKQIAEVKALRERNSKTKKQAIISQRIANNIGNEFQKAFAMGITYEQVMTEWENTTWIMFKAEWVKNRLSSALPNGYQGAVSYGSRQLSPSLADQSRQQCREHEQHLQRQLNQQRQHTQQSHQRSGVDDERSFDDTNGSGT